VAPKELAQAQAQSMSLQQAARERFEPKGALIASRFSPSSLAYEAGSSGLWFRLALANP
jgi:hypothetical protein